MSLNVELWEKGERVYDANITHNLGRMASACGVYHACWRPEEIHCKKAKHIAPLLKVGIRLLREYPEHYHTFDSENGWGTYEHFLPWLSSYLIACDAHPEARIKVSR